MTNRRRTAAVAIIAATFGGTLLIGTTPVGAASFTPGAAIADGDPGSLRDVIQNQATDPAGDTVTLDAGATYTLDACTGSLLHGDTPLTIVGNGATIDLTCEEQWILQQGEAPVSVSDVTLEYTGPGDTTGGIRARGPVELDSVDILDVHNDGVTAPEITAVDVRAVGASDDNTGLESGNDLDATRVEVTGFSDGMTGDAEVVVVDSDVHDNSEGGIFGGTEPARIERTSVVGNQTGVGLLDGTIVDSTIADNDARAFPSNGAGVEARGDVVIVNTTISGNTAARSGGGVYTAGALTLVHSTVVGNSAPEGANLAGDGDAGSLHSFANVVAAPASGSNCSDLPVTATAHDIEGGDDTCDFDTADVADVGLGPLGDNGGPTATHLPTGTSVLVDAVPLAECDSAATAAGFAVGGDQRGEARPQQAGCDVGAVELVAASTPVSGPSSNPPSGTARPAAAAQPTRATPRFTG